MGSQGHGNGNFRSPATWGKLVSGSFLGVSYFRIYENYLKKSESNFFAKIGPAYCILGPITLMVAKKVNRMKI